MREMDRARKIGNDVEQASICLARGELVAIPTETVYGLAANAFNQEAVLKIFEAKNRPQFNPLIVHTGSLEKMRPFLLQIPDWAEKLAASHWPGPLTLLLPRNEVIPDLVTAGLPRVAVRIPNHPLTLELLASLDFPLAAPSANPFGYISPTAASHVAEQLGDEVSYILDGGRSTIGIESTIIGADETGEPAVFRLGGLSLESIRNTIGKISVRINPVEEQPQSSGMLKSHYAPKTRLILGQIDVLLPEYGHQDPYLLTYNHIHPGYPVERQIVLSPTSNIREAAYRLFSALRELDSKGSELILAEPVPEKGIGRAINDRLKKAAGKG